MFCCEMSLHLYFPHLLMIFFQPKISKFNLNLHFSMTKLLAEKYFYSVLLPETHLHWVSILPSCLDKIHFTFYFLLTSVPGLLKKDFLAVLWVIKVIALKEPGRNYSNEYIMGWISSSYTRFAVNGVFRAVGVKFQYFSFPSFPIWMEVQEMLRRWLNFGILAGLAKEAVLI